MAILAWAKQYGRTHLTYLIVIGLGLVAFHSWQGEHDSRILADQQVRISETTVKASQEQIDALQRQIAATDAATAQQIASLTKALQTVKTPQQVVAALPTVAPNLPAPATVQPDNSLAIPAADVLPLFEDLSNGKIAQTKLAQCQSDYVAEQGIVAQQATQIQQKTTEITALKKPRGFWHRVVGTLKVVGIGIGIGATLAKL